MNNEYYAIEFPGIVKNVDKALDMLGGRVAVAKSLHNADTPMFLKFRPNNPTSHGLKGFKNDTTQMFICKKTFDDNGNLLKTEMKPLSTLVTFRDFCDIQYSVDPNSKALKLITAIKTVDYSTLSDASALTSDRFELLPPLQFLNVNVPRYYGFKQLKYSKDEQDSETVKALKPWEYDVSMEGNVPDLDQSVEINAAIRDLFERRPIWLESTMRKTLLMHDEDEKWQESINSVSKIAYMFVNGPWKNCWVKRGYDPRVETGSQRYQVVNILRKRRKDNEEYPHVFGTFQFCDLKDPSVLKFAFSTEFQLEACDKRTGWIPQSQILAVKNSVKEIFANPEIVGTADKREKFEAKYFKSIKDNLDTMQRLASKGEGERSRIITSEIERQMNILRNASLKDDEWEVPDEEEFMEYDVFGMEDE